MPFDALVANAGRLRILTTLASSGEQEFVHLRAATRLSDGNLATHAKRLQAAGLIAIHKEIRAGKPVTRFALNAQGRAALELHARQLLNAIGAPTAHEAERAVSAVRSVTRDEEWVD
jgi:DNA-binding transcriptional ArsR family regulator